LDEIAFIAALVSGKLCFFSYDSSRFPRIQGQRKQGTLGKLHTCDVTKIKLSRNCMKTFFGSWLRANEKETDDGLLQPERSQDELLAKQQRNEPISQEGIARDEVIFARLGFF
jgi:hypothetical protein